MTKEPPMKVVGLMTARNEDWILGLTLRAATFIVEEMIVLDHASTDRTRAIILEVAQEFPGRIHYRRREDPVWREASIRQGLLEEGRLLGGTHFWVIDADELLTGNLLPEIRSILSSLDTGDCITLPWFPMWRSLDRYRRDGNQYWCGNRTVYGFRDHPLVRYEPHRNRPDYDIHIRAPIVPGQKRELYLKDPHHGVMHFVAAGWARLLAKAAWYKMIETARFGDVPAERLNTSYNADLDEAGLVTVPADSEWWEPYSRWRVHVEPDAPSWFARDCQRMWREFGPGKFAGLDLWGVPQEKGEQ
jgi:glycosyltransferase involved in cell wall biosynthesis